MTHTTQARAAWAIVAAVYVVWNWPGFTGAVVYWLAWYIGDFILEITQ